MVERESWYVDPLWAAVAYNDPDSETGVSCKVESTVAPEDLVHGLRAVIEAIEDGRMVVKQQPQDRAD